MDGNPFDEFDAPAEPSNPFDEFDASAAAPPPVSHETIAPAASKQFAPVALTPEQRTPARAPVPQGFDAGPLSRIEDAAAQGFMREWGAGPEKFSDADEARGRKEKYLIDPDKPIWQQPATALIYDPFWRTAHAAGDIAMRAPMSAFQGAGYGAGQIANETGLTKLQNWGFGYGPNRDQKAAEEATRQGFGEAALVAPMFMGAEHGTPGMVNAYRQRAIEGQSPFKATPAEQTLRQQAGGPPDQALNDIATGKPPRPRPAPASPTANPFDEFDPVSAVPEQDNIPLQTRTKDMPLAAARRTVERESDAQGLTQQPLDGPPAFDEQSLAKAEQQRIAQEAAEEAIAHDKAAAQANTEPTEAQKEAGNYRKPTLDFQGLKVSVETPKGSPRRGTDERGKPFENVNDLAHYGYIKRTLGADGERVDAYIGPNPRSRRVFVVDQIDQNGAWDEHKVILGTTSRKEAEAVYDAGFSDGSGPQRRAAITEMDMPKFKAWLKRGDTTEPVAPATSPETSKPSDVQDLKPTETPAEDQTPAITQPEPHITGTDVAEPMFITVGGKPYEVDSIEQAQQMFIQARQTAMVGSSRTPDVRIVTGSGREVGRISYNGRVWPPGEYEPGQKPILEAPGYKPPSGAAPSIEEAKSYRPPEASEPGEKVNTSPKLSPALRLSETIADYVKKSHASGEPLTAKAVHSAAETHYGGTMASGKVPRDEMSDAVETGVNRFIGAYPERFDPKHDAELAEGAAKELEGIKNRLPTQTVRAGEKEALQQFSTPPDYAYTAAWVANLDKADRVLEPSAGTGSLAVFAKNAGAEKVWANDLSERRAEMLRTLGLDDVTTENAEHLNSILPADRKPTVVLMNPPFSAAASRMGNKMVTDVGGNHVLEALARLEPGGRLVAIVGGGMKPGAYKSFFNRLAKEYDLKANVGVDGGIYRKYGTTFPTRMLVIDKLPPSGIAPVMVEGLKDAPAIIEALKDVRASRALRDTGKPSAAEPVRKDVAGTSEGAGGLDASVPDATGEVGAGQGRRDGSERDRDGRAGPAAVEPSDVSREPVGGADEGVPLAGDKSERPARAGADANAPEPDQGRGEPARGGDSGAGDGVRPDGSGERAEPGVTEAPPSVLRTEEAVTEPDNTELTNAVYENYKPERTRIEGAKSHPGALVQSAAMASVKPPVPKHELAIPKKVVSSGALSDAQLEAVIYAGHSHAQMIPADGGMPERRKGFFIGDSTGVGKGREGAGIILDNWMHGRKKHIWVSEKKPLLDDARRDWKGIGQDAKDVFDHGAVKAGAPIPHKQGVLFTTYDTLKSGEKQKPVEGEPKQVLPKGAKVPFAKTRVQQIVDWVGPDFDGVILFDEAHNLGNAIDTKANRGMKKAAAKALAGVELQKVLPNARVVYVSATGATEVSNLAYADRLGLWGRGTAFADRSSFLAKISQGGVAAMELVARDMKGLGNYIARSLSYDGVEYNRLEHPLTAPQREVYDQLADAWQLVLRNFNAAMEKSGITETNEDTGKTKTKSAAAKSAILSQFWGGHQRFFNQVITSMQMPTVLRSVEADLKAGRQAVLQLVNTNEASQERALLKIEDAEALEDLDMTPRDQLLQLVQSAFPVGRFEEYLDDSGNVRSRPAVDSKGNPVQDPTLVAAREALIDKLGAIRVPDGPLEMLLNHFGTDKVSEITGRKQRVVKQADPKTGQMRTVVQKRPGSSNLAEAAEFQGAKKPILVFSEAGGTGRSYHAENGTPSAGARRSHYLVQAGWRADKAVQGFGRTHRTNQASAPIFHLVTTDLNGQKRFISSIARRLAQLGALTKGERRTGDQGLFGLRDNLESKEANAALKLLFHDVYEGKVPDVSMDDLQGQMGLKLTDPDTGGMTKILPEMTQFLNRLLSLRVDTQNAVFEQFAKRLDDAIDRAAASGTLDTGTETMRADKITKKSDQVVYTDKNSGAETRHVHLETSTKTHPKTFDEVVAGVGGKKPEGFVFSNRGKKVYAVFEASSFTDKDGNVLDQKRLVAPTDYQFIESRRLENAENWERMDAEGARKPWDAQVAKVPEYATEDLHLITGAVLPIWDRLQGSPKIFRLQTTAGEKMLGRVIPNDSVNATLQALGADAQKIDATPDQIAGKIMDGGSATLANGWKLKRSTVAGEQRIELIGPDQAYMRQLEQDGVFYERIDWKTRFFVPTGEDAARVIENVTRDHPVTDLSSRLGTAGEAQLPGQRIAGLDNVRRPSEDIDRVIDSHFEHGEHVGNDTVPLKDLRYGVSQGDNPKRVKDLADKIASPDGYLDRPIVDQDNNVLEGQHRAAALDSLGAKDVPVYRVRDTFAGIDRRELVDAIRKAATTHPEHANQIAAHAVTMMRESGTLRQALEQWDIPKDREPQFKAALRYLEQIKSAKIEAKFQVTKDPKSGGIGKLVGTDPGKMTPVEQKRYDDVMAIAERIMPRAKVTAVRKLQLESERGKADLHGATYTEASKNGMRRMVAWALEGPNARNTIRHEAVHFLRGEGYIKPKEWAVLEKEAASKNWLAKHDIRKKGYGRLSHEAQIEEAIAEEQANFRADPKGSKASTFAKTVFARIGKMLDAIAAHVRKAFGTENAADIMAKIESGEIGRREPGASAPAREVQFQRGKPTTGGEFVDRMEASVNKDELLDEDVPKLFDWVRGQEDRLYRVKSSNSADELLAHQFLKRLPKDVTDPAMQEPIYRHQEKDPQAAGLSGEQRQIFDRYNKPISDAAFRTISRIRKKYGGATAELALDGYVHRIVVGKGSMFDRPGDDNFVGNPIYGRSLNRVTSSMMNRTMFAAEDTDGNVRIVNGKGLSPDMEFEENGVNWKVRQATTREIEDATDLAYYKNALVNTLLNYLSLRRVERNLDYLDQLKKDPKFQENAVFTGRGANANAPRDYRSTDLPQLAEYKMNPKIVDMLDDYYDLRDPDLFDKVNHVLTSSIFINPVGSFFGHGLNVATHWYTGRGWDNFLPQTWGRSAANFMRAARDVTTLNERYRQMMREGSALLYGPTVNRGFHQAMLDAMGAEVKKNPQGWAEIAKAAGIAPAKATAAMLKELNLISSKGLWWLNDILMLQRVYDLQAKGMSVRDAIKDAENDIPNYRIPSQAWEDGPAVEELFAKAGMKPPGRQFAKMMKSPKFFIFGRYRYGMLKAYASQIRGAIKGDVDAYGKLLSLAALMALYYIGDMAWQAASGNDEANVRRSGPASLANNAYQSLTGGERDMFDTMSGLFSLTPAGDAATQILTNNDPFSPLPSHSIINTKGSLGEQAGEAAYYGATRLSPVEQAAQVARGSKTPGTLALSWMGLNLPDKGRKKRGDVFRRRDALRDSRKWEKMKRELVP